MKETEGRGGKDEMTVSSHWNFFFYPAGRRKKDEVNLHKRAYASVSSRVRSFFFLSFLISPLSSSLSSLTVSDLCHIAVCHIP